MKQSCTYIIEHKSGKVEFSSLTELDYFLSQKTSEELINIVESNIWFSVQNIENTKKKISEITSKIEAVGKSTDKSIDVLYEEDLEPDTKRKYNIGNSIGATRFISVADIDGQPLTRRFNEKEYFQNNNFNKNQIGILRSDWNRQTGVGSIIHKIGEHVIKGIELNLTQEELQSISSNEQERNIIIENIKNDFEWLIDQIKQKHGNDCEIFSEIPIISKNVSDLIRDKRINGKTIDSINGVVDLLVIDSNGVCHIYDFKISKKDVGVWGNTDNESIKKSGHWHSTKKIDIEYQMEIYRTILEQWGIHVGSTNIIPIKTIYSEGKIEDGVPVLGDLKSVVFKRNKNDGASIVSDGPNAGNMKRRGDKISKFLPVKRLTDNLDGLSSIYEPMSIMFPNYDISSTSKRTDANIDWLKSKAKRIPEGSPERRKGKYVFYSKFEKENRGYIYCQNEEELDSKLREYLRLRHEEEANEKLDLSEQIKDIMSGSKEFESLHLASAGKEENNRLLGIFRKYCDNSDWKYQENDSLAASGIFIFTKGDILEIVCLTDQLVDQQMKIGKGKTILGTKKYDEDVDEHKVLLATNGNLNLMKVMCLINSEHSRFTSYKINSISCFNTEQGMGVEQSPDILYQNFDWACQLNGVENNLKPEMFSNIIEHVQNKVEDLTGSSLESMFETSLSYDLDTRVESISKLTAMRDMLMKDVDVMDGLKGNKPNFSNPKIVALTMINQAILRLQNYRVYIEPNPSLDLETNGRIHVGINWTSPELSPSLNIQSVGNIVSMAQAKINSMNLKYVPKFKKVVEEFYKLKGRSAALGGEYRLYTNLFETDESGNISKEFKLKHPDHPSLKPQESNFIRMFLEIINDLKYNGDTYAIEEAKISGRYYEVPLKKSGTMEHAHRSGLVQTIKTEWGDALNFMQLFTEQQSEGYIASMKRDEAYNRYRVGDDTRKEILASNDIGAFETQLELVLIDYISTYNKEKVYNDILPQIQGMKLVLQYNAAVFGQQANKTLEYIDKYVRVNLFNDPIMEMKSVYKVMSTIKKVTSATVLGFNFRSGLRELMQGMWNHLSRTMVQMYGKGQFNNKDILRAWSIIFKLSVKNPNLITLLDLINADYRMANADVESMQDLISQSKTGLLNFGSDDLYIFNKIPDAYHRLGILIAKMLNDGSWDAHSATDDGELIYDFNKDKRFNLLNDKTANKNSKEYKDQLSLYLTMAEQLRLEGYDVPQITKDSDFPPLPRAYTQQEGNSIKSFADLCFGHYDKNTQMLAKHMFLGSFFLQYRTFLSAKLEQWILKPGTYNMGAYKECFDINGEQIFKVIHYYDNGIPKIELKKKSEIQEGEIFVPYKEWQGKFMEGITYSMWSFGKALFTMDTQELKRLWKNDTKRANFYLFINDMILMSIIMWLIYSLLLSDKEDLSPIESTTANALYTSFSDGPITELIASMGGDLNPPMWSNIKKLYSNTINMVSGDKSIGRWFTDSFGALRDFKNTVA